MSRDQEIILASLNTHGGRGADGQAYDLAAACIQVKADIIALQEVWHPRGEPDPVEEIAAALGAEAVRADLHSDIDLRSLRISTETVRGRWGLAVGVAGTCSRLPGQITCRFAHVCASADGRATDTREGETTALR